MRISGLYVYPVKSCQGLSLNAAPLAATGFVHDRAWMVVDPKGVFITQRSHPVMARIRTALDGDKLTLASDGHGDIHVTPMQSTLNVQVWGDKSDADQTGDDVTLWLTQVLETPARLVRCGARWQRSVSVKGITNPTSFADRYPFLVLSEASLADLNSRLDAPVPMSRFRPNIVVTGTEAFAEDAAEGRVLVRDTVGIRIATPCERCAITTTDQQTGKRDPSSEPLKTLASFRRGPKRGVIFGMNAVLDSGIGETLRLNDTFVIEDS